MKEATGELNMTVITVVAIAAVGALFTVFVWPNIRAQLLLNTACSQVDGDGNYESTNESTGIQSDSDGYIKCENRDCTVKYAGKTFRKTCKTS